MDVASVLKQMTLEEKCACLTGEGYWTLGGCARLGVAPITMSDGPHGLRHQSGDADNLGIAESDPAVCFPTASASACSFDTDLLYRMGQALGDEAREQGVAVVLGPGVNMKRSPLCGRNFEYFSEDPFLAGTLGAAYINGVQSRGIGVSLKHFACNNQETNRLISDSIVDEQALHELYLEPFRIAVEQGKPWTIMTAYNLLNGTYCSENRWLMNDIGRATWGFHGVYVSDWGAESSNTASLAAGLDLVMPGVRPDYRADVAAAVRAGDIALEQLDAAVRRVLELHAKHEAVRGLPPVSDLDARLDVAYQVAEQSAVLLKNDGALPLAPDAHIAVIGAFAKTPRYQGAGSSKINPVALDCAFDELVVAGASCTFAEGYDGQTGAATDAQLTEAVHLATQADVAVVFVGLPDASESEGADRVDMRLPEGHQALIEHVCAAQPNTVVVLQGGSPVELPWRVQPRAILLTYLAGCRGGRAAAHILLGLANPSGKLAETWPLSVDDTPCRSFYPAQGRQACYRESVLNGYRYYDAAGVSVAYPFGYGLSYTTFSYRDLQVEPVEEGIAVSCMVRNDGACFGREVVQVYVAPLEASPLTPPQQLKAWTKVALQPGEESRVEVLLSRRAFAHYSPATSSWEVEQGAYDVRVAASSRDVRLHASVDLEGVSPASSENVPAAYRLVQPGAFSEEAFRTLYGKPYPKVIVPKRPYTPNATIGDLKASLVGRAVHWILRHELKMLARSDPAAREAAERMVMDMPLRSLAMSGVDMGLVDAAVDILNYRFIRGIKRLKHVMNESAQ